MIEDHFETKPWRISTQIENNRIIGKTFHYFTKNWCSACWSVILNHMLIHYYGSVLYIKVNLIRQLGMEQYLWTFVQIESSVFRKDVNSDMHGIGHSHHIGLRMSQIRSMCWIMFQGCNRQFDKYEKILLFAFRNSGKRIKPLSKKYSNFKQFGCIPNSISIK